MKTYARIDTGIVVEIILPMQDAQGNEIAVSERFTPEFVATLVDITDANPVPQERWGFDGSSFNPPV